MGFRLVPKSVILNDLEWRNGPFCVISPNSVDSGVQGVKAFEDVPKLSATEM